MRRRTFLGKLPFSAFVLATFLLILVLLLLLLLLLLPLLPRETLTLVKVSKDTHASSRIRRDKPGFNLVCVPLVM